VNYQLLESSLVLAKVQFKLRVEGHYLGIAWYLLEPIAMFAILLSLRPLVGSGIEDYPLYLLVGLVMFNVFRSATNLSANAIVSNASLITSLKTNPEVFVLAVCFEALVIHVFEMLVVAAALAYFGVSLASLFYYPLVLLVFSSFICGVAFVLSVAGVYVSDIRHVWNALTRLLWFATPIFYAGRKNLPLDVDAVNPMYHYITLARDLLVYQETFDLAAYGRIATFSVATLLLGYAVFQKLKPSLAERL
jgi:ABC-type polysaccharide/polyol phosphate export permease